MMEPPIVSEELLKTIARNQAETNRLLTEANTRIQQIDSAVGSHPGQISVILLVVLILELIAAIYR